MRNPFRPRVALVLGGGGARGLAHLGVLKVLEREKISVDLVVGTSAGAMVGALYCAYGNTRDAENRLAAFAESARAHDKKFSDLMEISPIGEADAGFVQTVRRFWKLGLFFATTLFKPSYIEESHFEQDVGAVVPEAEIEKLSIPLAIVATDLRSGREVVLRTGPLRRAVMASSAIAGVFPPVEIGGLELVDGGFVSLVPVETALRLGADVVLAVDVSSPVADSAEFSRRGSAVSLRAAAIQADTAKRLGMRFADVVIRPQVAAFHWASFGEYRTIAPLGEAAAEAALPAIRAAIRKGWLRRPLHILFGHRRTATYEGVTP